MIADIQHRLNNAEEDLINSLNEGTLDVFEESWSRLAESLNIPSLDPITSRLAHAAAYRVKVITSAFLNIHDEATAVSAKLTADLENLFERLTLDDEPLSQMAPPKPSMASNHPPYIAPAYKWLLKNIHNPYPSKDTKTLISQATGTSLQNIDAWFLNTRRRIGWTSLSKRYFSGSKPRTASAAYRALIKDDHIAGEMEPLPANIRMAFVQMEATAKELYSDKFTKSALAGKLDGMVRDMTVQDRRRRKANEKGDRRRRRELERAEKRVKEEDLRWKAANALSLSSASSRCTIPASATNLNEEDRTPPLSTAGNKRLMSEDVSESGFEGDLLPSRPMKRSRVSSVASSDSSVASSAESVFSACSSRASSCTLSLSEHEPHPSALRPVQSAVRKRRLSEAGAQPAPKRRMVQPRLQVVSDPFPKSTHSDLFMTSSSDSSVAPSPIFEVEAIPNSEWSSFFFDTPEIAVLDELDLSVLRQPEFSCVAETAALLNAGNRGLHEVMAKGSDSLNSLDVLSYDNSNPSIHPDVNSWPYDDIPPLWSIQPITTSTDAHPEQVHEPLAMLDDFSLSSLPMNHSTTLTSVPISDPTPSEASSINNLNNSNWFPIIPDPLFSDGFAPNITFVNTLDDASVTDTVADPTPPPPAASALSISTAPLTVTPETRAEKYKQYRELLNKAKQLEAELGHS